MKILNSRCLFQILLNQNMALRSLSQSLSKSDFISQSVNCARYILFLYNSPRFLPMSYFSNTPASSVAAMFVFSFQSKLKACQGSIVLEGIKFEKRFKTFNAFCNFFPKGRDNFGQRQKNRDL